MQMRPMVEEEVNIAQEIIKDIRVIVMMTAVIESRALLLSSIEIAAGLDRITTLILTLMIAEEKKLASAVVLEDTVAEKIRGGEVMKGIRERHTDNPIMVQIIGLHIKDRKAVTVIVALVEEVVVITTEMVDQGVEKRNPWVIARDQQDTGRLIVHLEGGILSVLEQKIVMVKCFGSFRSINRRIVILC